MLGWLAAGTQWCKAYTGSCGHCLFPLQRFSALFWVCRVRILLVHDARSYAFVEFSDAASRQRATRKLRLGDIKLEKVSLEVVALSFFLSFFLSLSFFIRSVHKFWNSPTSSHSCPRFLKFLKTGDEVPKEFKWIELHRDMLDWHIPTLLLKTQKAQTLCCSL